MEKPFHSNFIAFDFVTSLMQLIIGSDYYFALSIYACVGMSVQINSEIVCLCISVIAEEYECHFWEGPFICIPDF